MSEKQNIKDIDNLCGIALKPLYWAACNGYDETIILLLDAGHDVNKKDGYGNTLLHYAANNGRTKTISLLLKKGADVNATNKDGETYLDLAKKKEYTEVINLLSPASKISAPSASKEDDRGNAPQY